MTAFGQSGPAAFLADMTPTAQQAVIVNAYNEGTRNIMISALAGTGKTSTLKLIAGQEISTQKILLVFNKEVQEEIKTKLQGTNTQVQTLNSFGFSLWKRYMDGSIRLDQNKGRDLIRAEIDRELTALFLEDFFQQKIIAVENAARGGDPLARKAASKIHRTIRMAIKRSIEKAFFAMRVYCYVPDSVPEITRTSMSDSEARLLVKAQLAPDIEDTPDDIIERFYQLSIKALNICIEQSLNGIIDFDDQVYMPAIWVDCPGSAYDTLLIDECQDLSEGNLMMLDKISYRRAVAVGDRNQAIYAFRGALSNSLDLVKEKYAMEEFPLNTCFRCGTNIIAEARRYVPTLESPSWMWEGEVIRDECDAAQVIDFIMPGDAVVCHVNAPLVGMAVKLIKAKIGFGFKKFAGMKENINHQLESVALRKFKQDDSFVELEAMREDKLKKLAEKDEPSDSWNDLFDCCKVLLEGTAGDVAKAIRMLDEISNCTGGVLLTSGHSSKGGEWESVFLLGLKDAEQILSTGMRGTRRLTPEELQQFYNLVYVMLTRAKRLLVICD